jgi:ankyrin repeat protein
LELYSRESGIGKLFYIVNSRLRTVKSIGKPIQSEFERAVTESCGDLSDFVRLVWEGLNFEFPETPRGEVVLYRGVELSESALESYRDSVGYLFAWSMFASFTEHREVAEGFGRAWRGRIPVLFELRSVWCRRLRNGTYLLHPFAVLQVETVTGNTVKLVEVELLEPGRTGPLPEQRPGLVSRDEELKALCEAAKESDVRVIAKLATRPELINAGDAEWLAPLHVASYFGKGDAVKALVWLGATVNDRNKKGFTPLFVASCQGHESTVLTLVSLGADLNVPCRKGMTPMYTASQRGREMIVRVLASCGADVNAPLEDGTTPVCIASLEGHDSMDRVLASLGANVNTPNKSGATALLMASQVGHVAVVTELLKAGASPKATLPDGRTALTVAKSEGHKAIVALLEKA